MRGSRYSGAPMESDAPYHAHNGTSQYASPKNAPPPSAAPYQPPQFSSQSAAAHLSSNVSVAANSTSASVGIGSLQQQPPQQQNLRKDDSAFSSLARTLLQKHAAYKYPPNYVIYNHLTNDQRRSFADAYQHRLAQGGVTTFAEAGEPPMFAVLREVREVFGPTLNSVSGSKTDPASAPAAAATNSNNQTQQQHALDLQYAQQQESTPIQQQDQQYYDNSDSAYRPKSQQRTNQYSHQQNQNQRQQFQPQSFNAYMSQQHQEMRDDREVHNRDVRSDHTTTTVAAGVGAVGRGAYGGGSAYQTYDRNNRSSSHAYRQEREGGDERRDDVESYDRDYDREAGGGYAPPQYYGSHQKCSPQNRGRDIRGRKPSSATKRPGTPPPTNSRYANAGWRSPSPSPVSWDDSSANRRETEMTSVSSMKNKSQVRQRLMAEIEETRGFLNRAKSYRDQMHYQNQLDQLKRELEDLTKDTGAAGRERTRTPGKTAVGEYVSVEAPANLPENYKFDAKRGKETFTATVPRGGVAKGQVFTTKMAKPNRGNDFAYVADNDDVTIATVATIATHERPLRKAYSKMDIPRGRWRDGLLDGVCEGPLHPLFWHQWFCPQIALAQVMSRLRILGPHKAKGFLLKSKVDLATAVTLTAIFYLVNVMMLYVLFGRGYALGKAPSTTLLLSCGIPMVIIDVGVLSCFYFLLIKTRKIIRENYEIPPGQQCPAHEDAFVSILCPNLTVAQMARHTADFTTYRGFCCTETGLPDHVHCDNV